MWITSWILLGLIAGAIAKAALPGRSNGGWLSTMILGIVGAIAGGFLGRLIFNVDLGDFFNIRTWVLAIVGSIVVLAIYGALTGKKTSA